jgi:deferrochelatase/peroxidase EfeB
VGEKGDKVTTRPAWAKDGSFLAFRKLKQYVPEFNAAMKANVLSVQGADNEELLAARLVGRWKDGMGFRFFFIVSLLIDHVTRYTHRHRPAKG